MLDQLDEEFGIGNLVKEEIHAARNTAYTEKNLKGLKVEHNIVSIYINVIIIISIIYITMFNRTNLKKVRH